jgi:hypothetical protein
VDTLEEMLSMLLAGAVDTLDIAPDLQRLAIARYEEVGSWLAEHGGYRCRIYPQGSFRLGTVVRPAGGSGEYDIDLVCLLLLAKEATTQTELKKHVGVLLRSYIRWKTSQGHADGPRTCESRRRCWTLGYPDHGFHLDVLPTIPDAERPPTGILLTDKQLYRWQHSNPIGYANWFRGRSEELRSLLSKFAAERHVNVADVPEWEVRSTLQRVVQVLKWHAMMFFERDPDNRPPSILITTLAARAYRGETDLFTATRTVLAGMRTHIENRHGILWVPNPAHDDENFADKWDEYPERREAFFAWRSEITGALANAVQLRSSGLNTVVAHLSKAFDAEPLKQSAIRYGEQIRSRAAAGALRMTPTGLLSATPSGPSTKLHTFYGQRSGSRG